MSKPPLRLYFDFISPYSYVAWHTLPRLAARHGREVEPVPILFAALLDAHGVRGPAEVPARRAYLIKDTIRLARLHGLPFAPPPAHPFNPLLALRLASLPLAGPERARLIDALYAAVWGGGPGVTDPATVERLLDAAGYDGAVLLARAGSADAKARLKAQSDAALRFGAFGVPTIDVDGELFFGNDSFLHIERFLDGLDPVDAASLERWKDLPVQSARKAAADRRNENV